LIRRFFKFKNKPTENITIIPLNNNIKPQTNNPDKAITVFKELGTDLCLRLSFF